jgi:hypothetical protein
MNSKVTVKRFFSKVSILPSKFAARSPSGQNLFFILEKKISYNNS